MALPEGKAVSEARIMDRQEGLRLHKFPQLAAPVSDKCMRDMLGNTQHVRAAAAACFGDAEVWGWGSGV